MTIWHMRLCVLTLIVAALLSTTAGCSSGGDCSPCQTDADCNPGETCSTFDDGSGNTERLCADANTSTCTQTYSY